MRPRGVGGEDRGGRRTQLQCHGRGRRRVPRRPSYAAQEDRRPGGTAGTPRVLRRMREHAGVRPVHAQPRAGWRAGIVRLARRAATWRRPATARARPPPGPSGRDALRHAAAAGLWQQRRRQCQSHRGGPQDAASTREHGPRGLRGRRRRALYDGHTPRLQPRGRLRIDADGPLLHPDWQLVPAALQSLLRTQPLAVRAHSAPVRRESLGEQSQEARVVVGGWRLVRVTKAAALCGAARGVARIYSPPLSLQGRSRSRLCNHGVPACTWRKVFVARPRPHPRPRPLLSSPLFASPSFCLGLLSFQANQVYAATFSPHPHALFLFLFLACLRTGFMSL